MKTNYLLFLLSFLFVLKGFSQIPNYLLYDKNQSQSFGAENSITAHKYLTKISDQLIPISFHEENSFSKTTLGISYRLVKLGLLDLQIDWLFMLTQHEVFGHGARAREFGYIENKYEIHPAPPYSDGSSRTFLGTLKKDEIFTVNKIIPFEAGGGEANLMLSQRLMPRLLLGNKMHYREGSLYLLTQNNLFFSIWNEHLSMGSKVKFNGDIRRYVDLMNGRQFSRENRYSIKQLANQSLISLLNPIQFYAGYGLFKSYLVDGESFLDNIPMIKFATFKYLPTFDYNLTPFGAEFISNHYFVSSDRLYQINLNYGDKVFFDFYGTGLKIFNIVPSSKFYLGAEVQLWLQPELQLGEISVMTNDPQRGGMFKADVSYFPFPNSPTFGFYSQIGYKSKGYALGEKLEEGLITQFGISLRPE